MAKVLLLLEIKETLIRHGGLLSHCRQPSPRRKMTAHMLPASTANETRHLKIVQAALFAGFVISGMIATILGPSLPTFIARWALDDTQAGLFFTTQFTGSLLGVLLSSAILSTSGYRDALVLGFFLMAAGVTGLNSASRYIAL